MATPLAIHNLVNGGYRTLLSVVGISIAIVLIFMQLGFLGAVTDTAVVFYDKMKFDLIACSPDYYNFVDCNRFAKEHFATIESVEGVASVQPLHVSLGKWNYEEMQVQRGMLIIGVSPEGITFRDPELHSKLPLISQPAAILVDRTSHPRFLGPVNKKPFGDENIGLQVELNGVSCKVAEFFEIGTGLASDGATVLHEDLYSKIVPGYSQNLVAIGLIQLAPDTDIEQTRDRILLQFPKEELEGQTYHSVNVLTRDEVEAREIRYWRRGTPIGFIFLAGAIVAFLVGSIIVYIVLSADISRQIGEYATLKAMGYRNMYLSKTVLEQAFILAVISYLCALVVSLVLYKVVGDVAKLPITMNWIRMAGVFVSSILMSFLSASIALQKLRQADPADLF